MTTTRLPKPFTEAELKVLYGEARPEVAAAMRFLHETGLRISEACAITRQEAEGWPAPPWWCRRAVCPRHRALLRIVGKGDKERTVLLSVAALRAAHALLRVSRNGKLMPWSDRRVRELFAEVGEQVGVHCHPHRFRHTFASELVEAGVPIEVVADMLGHSRTEITRLYWTASARLKAAALTQRARR